MGSKMSHYIAQTASEIYIERVDEFTGILFNPISM